MTSKLLPGPALLVALAALASVACNKDGHAASQGTDTAAVPSSQANCGHTACGSNFFVDAVAPADCVQGAKCTVDVKLVATGQFHINDEYPYKFKADDAPGVEYLGADAAGKNTFSRDAKDWKKTDEKSGVMTLAFRADDKGQKTVGGTFKLSVCSAQNCQLEQQPVKATVAVR
ncbi:MAG TPA: hypothetical protein VIY73_29305 [Polyangiaceae bacterium]